MAKLKTLALMACMAAPLAWGNPNSAVNQIVSQQPADVQAAIERAKTNIMRSRNAAADTLFNQAGINEFLEREVGMTGVDPASNPNDTLLVAISLTMPVSLIEAYSREAEALGAALVVRGIPDGWTMNDYLQKVMLPYSKRGVGLSIDPTVFDRYAIKAVPTIVWEPAETGFAEHPCQPDRMLHTVPSENAEVVVEHCSPLPSDRYWSISGAVTIDWALEQFADAGAERAVHRLNRLRGQVQGGNKEPILRPGEARGLSFFERDGETPAPPPRPVLSERGG